MCEIYDLCFRIAEDDTVVLLNTTAKAYNRVRIDIAVYNIYLLYTRGVCVCVFVTYLLDSHYLVVSAVRNASM